MMGHCDFIRAELEDNDPLAGDVDQIKAGGERATTLTRQLLAFSRKQALQLKILDLNELVASLEKMLRRLIGEDIDFVTALAADLGRVKADPGQIEQVIMNLALNARDAMPAGGKLTVETCNVELDAEYAARHVAVTPGSHVMIAVTDNGCGMDEETKKKIFDPFFTTKEPGKGTGLGLSTVYGIVKQSGGNIWVYSEPGRGTTFKIYLPRTEAEAVAKDQRVEAAQALGAGEHVLAVEDDPILRELMARMLKRLGYRATLAANGSEALLLVEEKKLRPDLILTDVVMPGMSGKELAERLHQTLPDTKVLYMSGYTDNAIVHHGVLDPGTPFLQKPFRIGDLGSMIESLLSEGRSEPKGRRGPA